MDPSEAKRQTARAVREAWRRGQLLRFIWIFRVVAVVLTIGMMKQTWTVLWGDLPPAEASILRYQTRNGFIADGVIVALLLILEEVRRRFERRVAERALTDPLPPEAWAPVRAANRIWALFYLWIIRLMWPLFFGLLIADLAGIFQPPMTPPDRMIFGAVGGAIFTLWAFVARTRGPWTANRGGRLER